VCAGFLPDQLLSVLVNSFCSLQTRNAISQPHCRCRVTPSIVLLLCSFPCHHFTLLYHYKICFIHKSTECLRYWPLSWSGQTCLSLLLCLSWRDGRSEPLIQSDNTWGQYVKSAAAQAPSDLNIPPSNNLSSTWSTPGVYSLLLSTEMVYYPNNCKQNETRRDLPEFIQ
jgi:hypothetical protein